MDALLERVSTIYKRMSHAAMRAGRGPEMVRLIAVSKGFGAGQVVKAVAVGLREFGENRVQEADAKIAEVRRRAPDAKVFWHLIGHLQKNKARKAVELFDLIQSVDSLDLAAVLNRHAADMGKIQRILVQVKLSDEESKHGIEEADVPGLVGALAEMGNLRTEGFMVIPPFFDDPEDVRPFFRRLRQIRENVAQAGFDLPELSMGMSNDFEVAITEGATVVRIGTALFGERNCAKGA
jgi:pyridoxal phosphate enzyme (YggS family)